MCDQEAAVYIAGEKQLFLKNLSTLIVRTLCSAY